MLKGYADVHVNAAIVHALRTRGMEVVTAQESGHGTADDADLLTQALREERAMLTNDSDFLVLAAQLSARQIEFAPILYWPQQERTVGEIVRRIVQFATQNDYAAVCSLAHYL